MLAFRAMWSCLSIVLPLTDLVCDRRTSGMSSTAKKTRVDANSQASRTGWPLSKAGTLSESLESYILTFSSFEDIGSLSLSSKSLRDVCKAFFRTATRVVIDFRSKQTLDDAQRWAMR